MHFTFCLKIPFILPYFWSNVFQWVQSSVLAQVLSQYRLPPSLLFGQVSVFLLCPSKWGISPPFWKLLWTVLGPLQVHVLDPSLQCNYLGLGILFRSPSGLRWWWHCNVPAWGFLCPYCARGFVQAYQTCGLMSFQFGEAFGQCACSCCPVLFHSFSPLLLIAELSLVWGQGRPLWGNKTSIETWSKNGLGTVGRGETETAFQIEVINLYYSQHRHSLGFCTSLGLARKFLSVFWNF